MKHRDLNKATNNLTLKKGEIDERRKQNTITMEAQRRLKPTRTTTKASRRLTTTTSKTLQRPSSLRRTAPTGRATLQTKPTPRRGREVPELRNDLLWDGHTGLNIGSTGPVQHTAWGPLNSLLRRLIQDERGHLRVARPDCMDLCSFATIHVVPTPAEPLAPPPAEGQIQSKKQTKRP